MKRRPSLTLTPRSYDFENEQTIQTANMYNTISDLRQIKDTNMDTKNMTKDVTTENFMITQDDFSTIQKKSLYEMTPQQLEISIEWKKKFLEVFEKKLKEAKNY